MHDSTTTIANFLDAAAAASSTPGGGSVTALVGALAASMGEMVLSYSLGKKGLEAHDPQLKSALAQFHNARRLLLGLMAEDQIAYESLTAARKLPHDSPQRPAELAAASLAAIGVPQAVAATAVAILDLSRKLVPIVNLHLLSDLAVCADMTMATARCAIYNIRINLPDIADPNLRSSIEQSIQPLMSRALAIIQELSPQIWRRLGQGT